MQEHALVRADGRRSPCSGKATTRRTDGYRVALDEKIPRREKTRQSTVTQSRWVGRYPESRAQEGTEELDPEAEGLVGQWARPSS